MFYKHTDISMLNIKGWKKIYHVNASQKKLEMATLISNKQDYGEKILPGTKKVISYEKWVNTAKAFEYMSKNWKRNKQIHNYSYKFQYLSINIW